MGPAFIGMLIPFAFLLATGCATITDLGLNPSTTSVAEGRAYYRIVTDRKGNWVRQIYTEAPTWRMNIVKPQGLIRQASNKGESAWGAIDTGTE